MDSHNRRTRNRASLSNRNAPPSVFIVFFDQSFASLTPKRYVSQRNSLPACHLLALPCGYGRLRAKMEDDARLPVRRGDRHRTTPVLKRTHAFWHQKRSGTKKWNALPAKSKRSSSVNCEKMLQETQRGQTEETEAKAGAGTQEHVLSRADMPFCTRSYPSVQVDPSAQGHIL